MATGTSGSGPANTASCSCDHQRNARLEGLDLCRDVGALEQIADVRVTEVGVEVHQLDSPHIDPRLPRDPGLDRGVGDVVVLHLAGRLDLDEGESIGRPLQHVDGRVDPILDERGLEDRGHTVVDCLSSRLDPPRIVMGEVDQHSAREQSLREGTDLDALIKPILQHHVHLELLRLRLVHLEPEQLVALPSGDEAGLGEVGGHGSNVVWGRDNPKAGTTGNEGTRCLGVRCQVSGTAVKGERDRPKAASITKGRRHPERSEGDIELSALQNVGFTVSGPG